MGTPVESLGTATSLLWIAPAIRGGTVTLGALRAAGFLPVAVKSVNSALSFLRQFRPGAVVLDAGENRGWEDCARLLAIGSPVAIIVDVVRPDVTDRYLSAGCAAVIEGGCPPDQLTAALKRLVAGDHQIVSRKPCTTEPGETSRHATAAIRKVSTRAPGLTEVPQATEAVTQSAATPKKRGRRPSHSERWTKATVVMMDREIVFLDRLVSEIRDAGGIAISRAHLIRALIDALAESDLDLTGSGSERDLRRMIAERFNHRPTLGEQAVSIGQRR
jgi:DNA-binding response OmpR family regulator